MTVGGEKRAGEEGPSGGKVPDKSEKKKSGSGGGESCFFERPLRYEKKVRALFAGNGVGFRKRKKGPLKDNSVLFPPKGELPLSRRED